MISRKNQSALINTDFYSLEAEKGRERWTSKLEENNLKYDKTWGAEEEEETVKVKRKCEKKHSASTVRREGEKLLYIKVSSQKTTQGLGKQEINMK